MPLTPSSDQNGDRRRVVGNLQHDPTKDQVRITLSPTRAPGRRVDVTFGTDLVGAVEFDGQGHSELPRPRSDPGRDAGRRPVRVPGDTWNRRAPEVAQAYRLAMPVPHFSGVGAVDPRVALFLAAKFGDALEAEGDDLFLRIAADRRGDPLLAAFLSPGDDSLKLS